MAGNLFDCEIEFGPNHTLRVIDESSFGIYYDNHLHYTLHHPLQQRSYFTKFLNKAQVQIMVPSVVIQGADPNAQRETQNLILTVRDESHYMAITDQLETMQYIHMELAKHHGMDHEINFTANHELKALNDGSGFEIRHHNNPLWSFRHPLIKPGKISAKILSNARTQITMLAVIEVKDNLSEAKNLILTFTTEDHFMTIRKQLEAMQYTHVVEAKRRVMDYPIDFTDSHELKEEDRAARIFGIYLDQMNHHYVGPRNVDDKSTFSVQLLRSRMARITVSSIVFFEKNVNGDFMARGELHNLVLNFKNLELYFIVYEKLEQIGYTKAVVTRDRE